MLFTAFVIGKLRAPQRFNQCLAGNYSGSAGARLGRRHRGFQRRQSHARITARGMCEAGDQLI